MVPSDTTHSIAVNGDLVQTVDSVTDGPAVAGETQDASSYSLPMSDASSSTGNAVADAAVDCESEVTGSSSAAVA